MIIGRKAGEAVMRGAHVFVPGTLAVSAGGRLVEGPGVAVARAGFFGQWAGSCLVLTAVTAAVLLGGPVAGSVVLDTACGSMLLAICRHRVQGCAGRFVWPAAD